MCCVPKQEVVRKVVREEISTAVLDLEVQCTCLYVHVAEQRACVYLPYMCAESCEEGDFTLRGIYCAV